MPRSPLTWSEAAALAWVHTRDAAIADAAEEIAGLFDWHPWKSPLRRIPAGYLRELHRLRLSNGRYPKNEVRKLWPSVRGRQSHSAAVGERREVQNLVDRLLAIEAEGGEKLLHTRDFIASRILGVSVASKPKRLVGSFGKSAKDAGNNDERTSRRFRRLWPQILSDLKVQIELGEAFGDDVSMEQEALEFWQDGPQRHVRKQRKSRHT